MPTHGRMPDPDEFAVKHHRSSRQRVNLGARPPKAMSQGRLSFGIAVAKIPGPGVNGVVT
jgi:hypothetical protein